MEIKYFIHCFFCYYNLYNQYILGFIRNEHFKNSMYNEEKD